MFVIPMVLNFITVLFFPPIEKSLFFFILFNYFSTKSVIFFQMSPPVKLLFKVIICDIFI